PVGVGDVVTNNCIKGAADPYYATQNGSGILSPRVGFTVRSNLIADPRYVNRAAGDYRLQRNSPCASILRKRTGKKKKRAKKTPSARAKARA
ncbi:MAG: hypothetical protein WB866_03195, partial [Solirubrobacterales bacterium]